MSSTPKTKNRKEVLLDAARMLSRAQDVEELLDYILERSREVMDCEVCSILLPEGKNGDLRIRSTLDPVDREPVLVPEGKGIAGEVFVTQEVVNIEDARKDPRHFSRAGDQSGLVTRAMLTIPLLEGERCLGVMQAINPNNDDFFKEEDESIFETFGSLIAVTLMRLETHRKAIKEAESRQQLETATEIQRSFLPERSTTVGNLDIEAYYEPASEVGGDFYFWHASDDDKTLLGIGDVCGKGLAAALDMARGTTMIASMAHAAATLGLEKLVNALNNRLCDVMGAGRFIAANFMLVDQKRRRVQLVVAGLPAPKIFDGSAWVDVEAPGNPPLGIASGLSYRAANLPLCAGRHWLVFSDGLLEVQNRAGAYYEDEAFEASLARIPGGGSGDILDALVGDWQAFSGDPTYQDDATMIALTDHTERPPADFEITIKPDNLKQARAFMETWTAYCGFSDKTAGLVILGCDEIFTNICRHAYCSQEGPATCRVETSGGRLVVRIRHFGDGICNEDLDRVTREPDPTRIGGLGMHVVREVFDSVDFQTGGESSSIELVKALE